MFTYWLYWYKFQSNVAVCCNEIIDEPIESVYVVSISYFDKEMEFLYFTVFVNKYKTRALFT